MVRSPEAVLVSSCVVKVRLGALLGMSPGVLTMS